MAMSRSESQIPDDCQFCHSWRKPDYTTMPKLTYPQWISGILQSPCIRCQYLLQAIRKLEPKFLELGSSVTADMKFWIFQNGEFFIDTTPRIGVIRIQLFSTACACSYTLCDAEFYMYYTNTLLHSAPAAAGCPLSERDFSCSWRPTYVDVPSRMP